MRLDERGLDEYTDRFEHEAFRHEALQGYAVASDGNAFVRWLAGQPVDRAVGAPWAAWVRSQRERGVAVRRLRTLTEPPSDYLRFEAEVLYTANTAAGEEIRILDLTERPRPDGLVLDEYWMLDGERVALMHYLPDGRFSHADTVEDVAARRIRLSRDAAWEAAEPFTTWWGRHVEYHSAGG